MPALRARIPISRLLSTKSYIEYRNRHNQRIGQSFDELVDAYFAAGLVGAYFAQGPGFSAEEHGCQVECGAASAQPTGHFKCSQKTSPTGIA